jgi:hypothetical protein
MRSRSQESLDKAKATLKRRWEDPALREELSARLRAYWKGRPGPMKGRTGFQNRTSRAVVTPLGVFGSGLEAARALGITSVSVRYRIVSGCAGYGYLGEEINDGSRHRKLSRERRALAELKKQKNFDRRFTPVKTPLGEYDQIGIAARELNVQAYTIRKRIERGVPGYAYLVR